MIDVFGTIFIIVFGMLFHYLYDWTNQNKIIGFFTAVNESTWEHLKLIIAPSFLWLIVEIHYYSESPNLFFAKLIGMLVMLLIIPIIFYTYMYLMKKNNFVINIISFVLAAVIGQYVFHILINMNYSNSLLNHIGIIGLILIFLRYITHTYAPDKNFLHKDPITKKYGIEGHLKK